MADGRDELIEAQKAVIGILFEVVKLMQKNSDLDGRYIGALADGGPREDLGAIEAERRANSEAIAGLLARLED